MVATGNPLAARAALQALDEGGSAIDAAIAADAVMGVVEPMATGIGGDLLAMIIERDGKPVSYNGTGRSPAALDADQVKGFPSRRIPERHPLSVTTPGAVQGWHDLHARYGKLPFPRVLEAATDAARGGFSVGAVCAREWALFDRVLRADPVCAALYRAGVSPRAGERFANPELAAVLESIARHGPDAFYRGEPARAAARANQAMGGVLAEEDFERHRGNYCEPLSTRFRGLEVLECPPNTHGIAVLEALDALEADALDEDDPRTFVKMVRAMARASIRAQATVADPAGNTVCTVVIDREGLAITLMTSVFKRFGSGIAAPGCGFVLQNRGFGFSQPGHVNGPAPRKRPFHTVVPGAALKDGRFHAAFGVVGGAMQPQGQLQIIVRLAAWKQPPQVALDAPRWRLESRNTLAIETGVPERITRALRDAGFAQPVGGELGGRSDFGGAQMVIRADDGRLVGASDKRKDGMACGA
jgi:gamma-glutamyltranspeptidase/glutathione hydrolase